MQKKVQSVGGRIKKEFVFFQKREQVAESFEILTDIEMKCIRIYDDRTTF